ncbi:polysaccharide biosynthesis tyrosine autokinase [Microbacterium sp.]|uniref:polysaccharide biosynthesis tyrosine autokinase n=1 Tax=Microbacterium sp. TaxID=51671 RepID=UPI003C711368
MELRDYLRVLRAHWIGVVVLTLAGVSVAWGWAAIQPRIYTADATGYVSAVRDADSGGAGNASLGDTLAKSKVKSFVDIGEWRSVADHVITDLDLDTTPEALVKQVSVSSPLDTVIIQVTADASSPEEARELAGAWLDGMAAEVQKLETSDGAIGATVELVPGQSAQLPSSPSSPNTRLALIIGGLVGLALGIGYAVLRFVFDRRIRSAESVERETGLNVVGAIPDERSFTKESRLIPLDGGNSSSSKYVHLYAVSEAIRELRTNIQYMDVDNPPRSIVITSSLPGEGKSTIAANLAITLASNGQPVVLIDGDLRRPMIASIFGLVGEAGLTDVLAGRATFSDVAQQITAGKLIALASGRVPPNPSELLGSQRMRDLIAELSKHAFVIVDAPPLIPVTDAAVLSHATDGALVVATVGRTTVDALAKAHQNLDRAGGRALGVVLNRVPRKGAGASYYGYQYTGKYYRAASVEGDAASTVPDSTADLFADQSGESADAASRRRERRTARH